MENTKKYNRLIIVSYRLPLTLEKKNNEYKVIWNNCRSSIANFKGFDPNVEKFWIGILSQCIPNEDKEEVEDLLYNINCIPIFLNKQLKYKFYEKCCKNLLWPVLHYSIPSTNDINYSQNWAKYWSSYIVVNSLFVKKISIYMENENTLVWIHNYQLFLVPSLLRKKKPAGRIGFFIHTVFPSSDVFRCLPESNTIIHSMLCCDMIGFHTYDYARHFFSCCRRLLYLELEVVHNGCLGFRYHGRKIGIKISHLGINSTDTIRFSKNKKVQEIVSDLQKKYENKKIILSIDGTDVVKGGALKLQGYHNFLENYPEFRDNVILFEFLLEERSLNTERRGQIYTEIENIKKDFGNNIIKIITFKKNNLDSLLFLASVCKVSCLGLFSSYWDGLNTFPYEYTLLDEENPGSLIISKFMGCYRSLPGVLSVNPLCLDNVSLQISEALTMNIERRKILHKLRYNYVIKHNFDYWANDFITELLSISSNNSKKKYFEIGWGSQTKLIALDAKVKHLDKSNYICTFNKSEKRLILLDYGGTIVERQNNILLRPSKNILNNILQLSIDPKNIVIIISGQTRKTLEDVFKKCKSIGLIAEKGAFIKWPNTTNWIKSYKNADIEWIELANKTIQNYTERTPGSYKELKETYILWNYENSDPEYGKMQAFELSKYLGQILKMKNVVRTHYEMSRLLEIKFKNISKRNATKIALGYFQSQLLLENIDRNDTFIMSIGNDISDDKICSLISDKFDDMKNKYTVTIGLRPTTADFYLNDVNEVSDTIGRLIYSNNSTPVIRYSRFMDSLYKKI